MGHPLPLFYFIFILVSWEGNDWILPAWASDVGR